MLTIDFETRSRVDLRVEGVERYIADPDFAVLCLGWQIGDERGLWCPLETAAPTRLQSDAIGARCYWGEAPPVELLAHMESAPVAAHNAFGFDAQVWQAVGLPEPACGWVDTMHLARMLGLPARLNDMGEMLNLGGKDEGGAKQLAKFYKPNKLGGFLPFTWNSGNSVMRYCVRDVELAHVALRDHLMPALRSSDFATLLLDEVVNDRGYCFDVERANRLIRLEEFCRADIAACAEEATGGAIKRTDLTRTKLIKDWLEEATGEDIPDCRRATLEPYLNHDNETVRAVVAGRLGVTRISTGKLDAALNALSDDGRLRRTLVYHGAHTGRWSGRRFQPHNLPRPKLSRDQAADASAWLDWCLEGDDPAARCKQLAGHYEVSADALISSLIRSCVKAAPGRVLIDYDFSAIEARGICWLAGDEEGLQVYREGRDPYKVLASKLFNMPYDEIGKKSPERALGKAAVLGAGFGCGPDKFRVVAEPYGVDFDTSSVTPIQAIEAYRESHPLIAGHAFGKIGPNGTLIRKGGMWKDLEAAAKSVLIEGGERVVARCRWFMWRDALCCELPSGRRLHYRYARIMDIEPSWGGKPRPTITFMQRPGVRVSTYSGKLAENVTQATCRDLLAHSMLKVQEAGEDIVLHIHDAIICETDVSNAERADQIIQKAMLSPPAWAEGFPIEIEGGICDRFH